MKSVKKIKIAKYKICIKRKGMDEGTTSSNSVTATTVELTSKMTK